MRRRSVARTAMVLGAVLLLAACGGGQIAEAPSSQARQPQAPVTSPPATVPAPTSNDREVATPSSSSPPAEADPTSTSLSPPAPETITVAAAGDVHGESPIEQVLAAGDNPLAGVGPLLATADVSMINLETALGSGGVAQDKAYTFQAGPALAAALADAGVDVVNLANNHSGDYGVAGLRETIAVVRDAGLSVVGAGESAAEAYAPHVVDVDGTAVAVIGLSHVIPDTAWAASEDRAGVASAYDHARGAEAVAAAAEQADRVVVMVHWGTPGTRCPNQDQRTLAPMLVEAGADVVAGHHPHRLHGVAHRRGAVISWSLGNFVWYPTNAANRRSGVLQATIAPNGPTTGQIVPVFIDDGGRPQPAAGQRATEITRRLAERSPACDPAPNGPTGGPEDS